MSFSALQQPSVERVETGFEEKQSYSSLLSRHRDTFARIKFTRLPAPIVPRAVFDNLLHYLTFDEFKSLRLVSRKWLTALPTPRIPSSFYCPSDVLQQIYTLLSPGDFDAARHTCRSWFLASLESRSLLVRMSRRAACYNSVQKDLELLHEYQARRRSLDGRMWTAEYGLESNVGCCQLESDDISEEWVFSKRLAIETMLSADWRGTFLGQNPASVSLEDNAENARAPVGLTADVDFSPLLMPRRRLSEYHTPVNTFTISGCGRFVLVSRVRMVYIYELGRASRSGFKPNTSIHCPRDVIGVSMDTSSRRYAVAILLEGRVGMCCELMTGFEGTLTTLVPAPQHRASVVRKSRRTSNIAEPTWFDQKSDRCDSPPEYPPDYKEDMLVESGPRTMYNNLCSFEDPPRSVAICPQRRCVAFGCRMGVELHWVDALTGGGLNRWFPLAVPSDYLYFLPAPPNTVDSARKLRLISSAAGSYNYLQYQHRRKDDISSGVPPTFGRTTTSRTRSMTRLFFGNLPFPAEAIASHEALAGRDQDVLRTVDCDHYRAVPLSDGLHLLFTDPEGHLCLGSDAPLGGPTKLLRKVVFVPPSVDSDTFSRANDVATVELSPDIDQSTSHAPSRLWPLCYASGKHLGWGVRIVAAYRDGRIILYCIPRDAFERLAGIKNGQDQWDEQAGVVGQSDLLMDGFMPFAHGNTSTSSHASNETDAEGDPEDTMQYSTSKSILLRGAEIARVTGDLVGNLAVNSDDGSLRIWAFLQSSLVRVWTLAGPLADREESWIVEKEGMIRKAEEPTGFDMPPESYKEKERATDSRHIQFQGMDGVRDEPSMETKIPLDLLSSSVPTSDTRLDRSLGVGIDFGSLEAETHESTSLVNVVENGTKRLSRLEISGKPSGSGRTRHMLSRHDRLEIEILADLHGYSLLGVVEHELQPGTLHFRLLFTLLALLTGLSTFQSVVGTRTK